MSQRERLRTHFEHGNSITRLTAFNDLGIAELSSRIGELEATGYPIDREWMTVTNRFNEKVRVMRYSKQQNFDWHLLDVQPPDELVEVQDDNGNIAKAYPTYYPFMLDENKTGGKISSNVIHCEPYWDGSWMIQCEGLESNIDSNIVRWRACF